MRCPECGSVVDHSDLVNGPKGEEYYVCPNCKADLVHNMSFGIVMLSSIFGLPILWIATDFVVASLLGSFLREPAIGGIEAVDLVAFAVVLITSILFIRHSIRLVSR